MEPLTHADLTRLARYEARGCVSIYVPMHTPYTADRSGPITLKNGRDEAERQLVSRGWRSSEARDLLKPVDQLVGNEAFWREPTAGLAVFVGPDLWEVHRLHEPVRAFTAVGRHLYLKPLWAELPGLRTYHVLSVSQHGATLYRGNRGKLEAIPIGEVPHNLRDVLGDHVPEKVTQAHGGHSATHGKTDSVFHGQGDAGDFRKAELTSFLRDIDEAVMKVLGDDRGPLVFAGVEYLFPIYREVTANKNVWPAAVHGNTADWTNDELRRRALEVLQPWYDRPRREDIDRFENGRGGDRDSASVEETMHAAAIGQVDFAFVAVDECVWGVYDKQTGTTQLVDKPGGEAEDILDRIATLAFVNGGRVHVVPAAQIPDGLLVAAHYRYPRMASVAAVKV